MATIICYPSTNTYPSSNSYPSSTPPPPTTSGISIRIRGAS